MSPIRAAIYARCSSLKQAEKDLSIPAQLDHARAHAAKMGWIVTAEYVEQGSATSDERKEFQRMVEAARRPDRAFDVIIVWKLSRFARNREDSVVHKNRLQRHGVRVVSINEQLDDSASGKMMEAIIEAMDECFSRNLAQDTQRGMRQNAARGQFNGGTPPIGFLVRRSVESGKPRVRLEPDPETAPVVRRIFSLALSGTGACAITEVLNAENIRTRRGKRWSKQAVLVVLRNEMYTGTFVWGSKPLWNLAPSDLPVIRVEKAHEALVTPEDFARVQAGIVMRRREHIHPRTAAGPYLLSGLLTCGLCAAPYTGHPAKGGAHHYYTCQTKTRQGAKACKASNFEQHHVESVVLDALRDVVLRPEHFRDLVRLVQEELRGTAGDARDQRLVLEAQRSEVQRRLEKLYEAIEAGAIPYQRLAPRIEQWATEDEKLAAQLAADANPILQVGESEIEGWVKELRELVGKGSLDERRALLRAWILRITVDGDRLKITWTLPLVGIDDGGGGPAHTATARLSKKDARPALAAGMDEAAGSRGWFAPPELKEGEPPRWRVLPTVKDDTPNRT